MTHLSPSEPAEARLTVAENGRVVIPAPMRAALGLTGGARVLARIVDGALVLEPIDVAVARARAMVAAFAQPGISLAESLIADRHDAAASE
jgi:AbrB family looped-hinge helix DNA binding protein